MALAKLIADSTVRLNSLSVFLGMIFHSVSKLVTVNEVLRSLRKIEVSFHTMNDVHSLTGGEQGSKLQESSSPKRNA
jgi:hypothetical protein